MLGKVRGNELVLEKDPSITPIISKDDHIHWQALPLAL